MKKFLTLATGAFVSLVSANLDYYDVKSAPFRLFLKSTNSTLNGTGKHLKSTSHVLSIIRTDPKRNNR